MEELKVCACLLRTFQSCGLLLSLRLFLCLRVLVLPVLFGLISVLLPCFCAVLGPVTFLIWA